MHEEILVGNMVSDFVKGKKKFDYSIDVQKGITLHRSIDTFTDSHPVTKEAKQYFKPAVGLYAGAFIDVVYDHFLAIDHDSWKESSLSSFAQHVYNTLEKHLEVLPERFQRMLPYMISHDWLTNYQYQWGIQRSFEGLTRRAVYLNDSVAAYEAFIDHYEPLQHLAFSFLADVKKYALEQFEKLVNT